MSAALHHALLGVSLAALWGAGVRVASLAAPGGLERAVAAVVLAAAVAVVEALALGLVGLGSDPLALGAAACLTWLAARSAAPAAGARPAGRALAALAGAVAHGPARSRRAGGRGPGVGDLAAALPRARVRRIRLPLCGGGRLGPRRHPGLDRAGQPRLPGGQLPAHRRGAGGLGRGHRPQLRAALALVARGLRAARRGRLARAARAADAAFARRHGPGRSAPEPLARARVERAAHGPRLTRLARGLRSALRRERAPAGAAGAGHRCRRACRRHQDHRARARGARAAPRAGPFARAPASPQAGAPGGACPGIRGGRHLVPAQPDPARLALVALRDLPVGRPGAAVHRAARRALPRAAARHARGAHVALRRVPRGRPRDACRRAGRARSWRASATWRSRPPPQPSACWPGPSPR